MGFEELYILVYLSNTARFTLLVNKLEVTSPLLYVQDSVRAWTPSDGEDKKFPS